MKKLIVEEKKQAACKKIHVMYESDGPDGLIDPIIAANIKKALLENNRDDVEVVKANHNDILGTDELRVVSGRKLIKGYYPGANKKNSLVISMDSSMANSIEKQGFNVVDYTDGATSSYVHYRTSDPRSELPKELSVSDVLVSTLKNFLNRDDVGEKYPKENNPKENNQQTPVPIQASKVEDTKPAPGFFSKRFK